MAVEEKLVKIVDATTHSRGLSLETVGSQNAAIVKIVEMPEVTVGAPVGGATSDNQTNGNQKTQIVDAGGEAVTVTGGKLDVNATASLAGTALPISGATDGVGVAILDGSGNQITSFGGGTQYSDADANADPTGTVAMGTDGTNVYAVHTDTAGDLQVDILTLPAVTATNLDIRDLTNADVVTAELSAVDNAVLDTIAAKDFATQTTLAAINAKLVTGTDIGDVTVNNAGGASAVNIQDGGNAITVDGAVTATLSAETTKVIGTVNVAAAQTIAVTQGTATNLKAQAESYQGGTAVGAANPLQVTLANGTVPSHAVTNAGTFAVQSTNQANSGVDIGDVTINNATGAAAVNVQDGGNSLTVDYATTGSGTATGALRVELPTNGTGVVGLNAGTNAVGKLIPPDYDVTSHTAKAVKYYTSAGAATDGIIWSPAAGKRWHVVTLFINVSAAATVTLEDDLSGGDNPVMKMELAANSGVAIPFGEMYPLTSAEDAADLIITTSAGNVYVTAVGYEI